MKLNKLITLNEILSDIKYETMKTTPDKNFIYTKATEGIDIINAMTIYIKSYLKRYKQDD